MLLEASATLVLETRRVCFFLLFYSHPKSTPNSYPICPGEIIIV
uniref:Uncharacterized protein n=1 Tax=Anguilla anguilla TaxID=7936 RepID=A0A0E9PXA7_ANGAN